MAENGSGIGSLEIKVLLYSFHEVRCNRGTKNCRPIGVFEMARATSFHEDVFYEYFRPFRHPDAEFDIWGGHGLETFGGDLQIVRQYDQDYVWTLLEGDKGEWIVPGFHYVNRLCYLLTEVPHSGALFEFRVTPPNRSLTPLGLSRRISTLRRVMARSA